VSNNATVSGGAINSVSSLIDFSDASAEFYNNRSKTGGAIYAQSSTVTFSGGSINFSTNIVSAQENSGGGAIAADLSYINFDSGNIFFLANSSTDTSNSGGALLANDSEIKFENSNVDFTENKAGKNGGAIYAQSSTITFSAGSINFSTNIVSAQENAGGGAIAAELSYIKFDSGNISFSQNSAADASNSGGALLANDSEIKFENSNVDFTENKAGKNGGAVMLENSNFNISAGTTNFINNNAAVSGGAVNAVSSLIDFSGAAAKFYNNMSKTGGAIYAQSSTISFSASAINFSTNIVSAQINAGGGAIAADLSYITFDFGNILFLDNSATEAINSGGALLANDSEINFVNSDVKFTGNKAGKDGGAIANLNSSVYVVGDEGVANEGIVFYRNKALSGNGGAIYNAGLLSIIEEDRAEFQENTASSGGGGAIFNSADGIINFSKSIGIFIENTAANGGAIYNEGEEIKFDSGGASFYQNSAQNGGALFISGSSVNFDATNTEFTENNADVNGGAIYLEDSQLFLNADGAPISFSGNTAGGVSNDIYMKGASNLNISGDSLVRLEGGIKAARSSLNEFGHEIIKTGSGVMELGGINDIESIFDLKEGELRLLQDVSFKIHDATVFAANTKFNMQNGSYDTAEISYLGTSGDIAIEVSADGGYDKIITNKTEITGGNLFIETGIGGYDDQEYYIVVADTGELTGKFDTVQGKQYDTFVLGDLLYDISYVDDTYIKLTLSGYEALRFANINKFTYNQQQVANALHKISMNDPKGHILKTMNYMKNKLSDEQAQAALKQLSAHFLSNFIRNFAADSPNNEIYDKIKKHSSKDGGQSGAWAQMKGGVETFKGNDNSEGDYTNSSIGAMAGYDKYLDAKNILYGVYARFSKDSIEQYSNKADGQKNGLGLYGGYIEDEWEVKAMLLGSYDIFNTKRHIQLIDATAKADISAFTLNWDMEGALKFKVIDNVVFRPYLGFELEDTNYGSVKEKDAPGVNLEIDGGTYLRTAARIGAGAEYTKNIINVYANLEGKYLISGYEPEIQSAFEGTDVEFTSKGTKEGRIALGIGLGGEIQVASAWKVYINGNYYLAENYSNIYGNAGVRYMFGQ
ncbi:MAG: autotransporter domain-containing protein, partial [Endomicrobium sp.]|nr:autotransporter domain-containing protein [Endomicrobium sp.]